MNTQYVKFTRDEATDHAIYARLIARERKPENKAALEKLAAQERSHYAFWKTLAGGADQAPNGPIVRIMVLMRIILGVTFTTKFLELHEQDAIEEYQKMRALIPEPHKARLEEIIKDELTHEQFFISQLSERRVAYLGFVALGLADAIVEITGVHAGFLGVTGSTLIAGVSGIVVGFAAAISMGSAAYLQAKQDKGKSAIASAVITGISYMASVVCLALPYFLIQTMLAAFITSAVIGILLLTGFTFYGAVIFDRKFFREFSESVSLMLGTALATYLLGKFIGGIFHLNTNSF